MNRNRVWLRFMLERIARLEACSAAGQAAFLSDELLQDAAVRNLQVLAEISTRLSGEMEREHRELCLQWLRALRNLLVHEPLSIDPQWLWDCLEHDVPVLRQAVETLLA